MFSRILINTKKHITRSGWIGAASVFTMSLAFLVVTIFGSLAFVSNLYLQYIESRSNLLVFFEVGMDQKVIQRLQTKWETNPEIKSISYLTEEQAYKDFSSYSQRARLDDIYEVLQIKDEKRLQSSLEIQLYSLNNLAEVQKQLQSDIDAELKNLIIISPRQQTTTQTSDVGSQTSDFGSQTSEQPSASSDQQTTTNSEQSTNSQNSEPTAQNVIDPTKPQYLYSDDPSVPPITLKVNSDALAAFSQMFSELRIAGIVIISLLVLVVVFFIFMTTEFRLFNQMEEIGVMQLVGGSLSFIRAPYILEGGFYGFMGAFLSSGLIALAGFIVVYMHVEIATFSFIIQNFAQLPWPEVTTLGWIGLFGGTCVVGFILGAVSSYLSIRRYIR